MNLLRTLAMIVVLIGVYIGPPIALAFLLPLNHTAYISLAYYSIGWLAALVSLRLVGWWHSHGEVIDETDEFNRLRARYYAPDEPCHETLDQLRSRDAKRT